ncbi:MAG: hypothetical protein K940chlam7_01227 [Chlamydiae bacterium]|nr:hypothetical protein [Chlamydiota bacterium]
MELKPISFFKEYIINPFSSDLTLGEKILALALSILLAPITLGILHIVCYALRNRHIRQCKANLIVDNNDRFQNIVNKTDRVARKILQPNNTTASQDDVPQFIQKMIEETYAQPLPERSEVEVPFRDGETWDKVKTVKWGELSPSEKIELNNHYAHPHNRVEDTFFNRALIDAYFFGEGQSPYLENDPKKHHGSDHAVRAGIFAGVFAYLYNKYHPDYDVTSQDVTFAQLVASGHDCARQTEGTDVYDDWSAEKTLQVLKDMGVSDPKILEDAKEAIADKDSKDYEKKSLIAKCVQNADCAEFYRLSCDSPVQRKASYEHSRDYLDIFQELKELSGENLNHHLKGNATYGDFLEALDAVRYELNLLIYRTHQKGKRKEFSEPGKNYYNKLLAEINRVEFPLINSILMNTEIKAPIKPKAPEEINNDKIIARYMPWKHFGSKYTPTHNLQTLRDSIDQRDSRESTLKILRKLDAELQKRTFASNQFDLLLKILPTNSKILEELLNVFAKMSPILRDEKRKQLLNELERADRKNEYKDAMERLKDLNDQTLNAAFMDLKHSYLKKYLKENPDSSNEEEIRGHAQELKIISGELLGYYNNSHKKLRDIRVQTTVSLALEKACSLYLKVNDQEGAKKALDLAAKGIIIDEDNAAYNINHVLDQLPEDKPVFLVKGCGFLRNLHLRACKKIIDGDHTRELSFELPSKIRKEVNKKLELLQGDPNVEITTVVAAYPKKNFANGEYESNDALSVGRERKITFKDSKIEVYIGNSKFFFNQYHLVRLQMKEGTTIQQCHQALAKIGLPMALMQSRPEDAKKEALAHALILRFPSLYYSIVLEKKPEAEPKDIYNQLTEKQKSIIDKDLKNIQISYVNENHLELVNPHLGREAWNAGARALGAFVNGGNIEETSGLIAKILQSGFLSSQERFQRGILGLGCCPKTNYWAGSGNQVFTRTLPKSWFEKEVPLENFAIRGPVMVLLDVQAFERMPYSHPKDRSGLRNPDLISPLWTPINQPPEFFFSGKEKLKEMSGFADFITELDKNGSVQTETMFDITLGPQYIRKLVVTSRADKYVLMKELESNEIYEIAGTPLEDAVIVSDRLQKNMVDNFEDPKKPSIAAEAL